MFAIKAEPSMVSATAKDATWTVAITSVSALSVVAVLIAIAAIALPAPEWPFASSFMDPNVEAWPLQADSAPTRSSACDVECAFAFGPNPSRGHGSNAAFTGN